MAGFASAVILAVFSCLYQPTFMPNQEASSSMVNQTLMSQPESPSNVEVQLSTTQSGLLSAESN